MMAIVMELCRLGNLFKMIKNARKLQVKMRAPDFVVDQNLARQDYYRFYHSWERRLEVRRGGMLDLTALERKLGRRKQNTEGQSDPLMEP